MLSELLKTIFQQNQVDFNYIAFLSGINTSAVDMLEQSKVDCSVLSFENELFVALNPATHVFDLSRLNKITGKTLSRVDNEEQIIKNSNRKVHVFIDEALEKSG